MKKGIAALLLAGVVLAAGQAFAGFGFGLGSWWMDGDETPQGAQGAFAGTCLGDGTQPALGLGLGLGYGDGTQPQPQDGTGFGSPLVR